MPSTRHHVRFLLLLCVVAALGLCLGPWFGRPSGSGAPAPSWARPDGLGPAEIAIETAGQGLARSAAAHVAGEPDRPAAGPAPSSPPPVVGIVLDAAGVGIAGAEVRAYHDLGAGFDVPFEGSTPARAAQTALGVTASGPDGRFELVLGSWSYAWIVAEAQGFVAARADAVRAGDSLVLTLHPAATLTVTVLDEGNLAPIGGVEVRVRHGVRHGLSARATTDMLGRAAFPSLTPGPATYEASTATFARQWPAEVILAPGASSEVELRLGAATEVRGVVRDRATGHTIAGARVSARPGLSPAVVTDAAGSFRVAVDPERPGTVFAIAPGYGRGEVRYEDPHEPVELSLLPGLTVLGQVVGPDEVGLTQVDVGVFAVLDGESTDRREHRPGVVDGEGRFVVTDVRRDLPVVLRLRAPGHGAEVVALDVAGAVDGVLDVGVLTLHHDARIYGRVLDGDGEPVGDVPLELVGTTWGDRFGEGAHWVALRSVTTDAAGRFEFAELASGDWVIRGDLFDASDRGLSQRVAAGASMGEVVLRVPRLNKVRGVVLDATTGAGVAGTLVLLRPCDPAAGEPSAAFTDEHGGFVLRTPLDVEFDLTAWFSAGAQTGSESQAPAYDFLREGPFTLVHRFVELRLKRSEQ